MKKILILLIGMMAIISSCSEQKNQATNRYGLFTFGMTPAEVDSVASLLGLENTNRQRDRMAFKGSLSLLGKNWNWIGLEFANDTLCSIEYQDWYANINVKTVEDLCNQEMTDFNFSRIKSFGYPTLRAVISGNEDCLSMIENSNGTLSLLLIPYTENNEISLIKSGTSTEIERTLKELTQDLANYLKESDPVIKSSYGDDVRREIKYLDDNIPNMSARQKEYFYKIRNL